MKDLLQTWQFHHGFQPFVETSLVGLRVGIHILNHWMVYPRVGSWETCFSFPWGTNIRKQRMLFDAWLHFDWDIIFLLSNPSLPHSHCIAETSMDKDNDAEGIWHKKGRCGKGSCVAQEKSMVLLKRWWTSGSRGDYFGSWGNWPQTWRSRWATFWLMTCHDRLTCRLKIWIAGHVWWGGRRWTLPVVVGSHGSWNWEAGGGIWGPNSIQKIATDLSIKKHREFMAFQATVEGQQFDEYGAMWISDGLGGVTWQCWCCFQTTVRKSQSLNFIPKSWKDKCLGRWYDISYSYVLILHIISLSQTKNVLLNPAFISRSKSQLWYAQLSTANSTPSHALGCGWSEMDRFGDGQTPSQRGGRCDFHRRPRSPRLCGRAHRWSLLHTVAGDYCDLVPLQIQGP